MKITRYMDFATFASLLKDGLFVPRLTSFDDKWEGLMLMRKIAPDGRLEYKKIFNKIAPWIYVSCWHKGGNESFGMWKVYGQSLNAVAIVTSLSKLESAYQNSIPKTLAYMDVVTYVLPESPGVKIPSGLKIISKPSKGQDGIQFFPVIQACFLKHKGHKFEKEIRLVAFDNEFSGEIKNTKRGMHLDYRSVPKFIESVRVSPGAPSWFKGVVKDLLHKYRISAKVSGSELEGPSDNEIIFG